MSPQVVAHRGASHENAEHTLGAYLRALDVGADALECDVRLTADGHLVCVHDRSLRRTASHHGIVSTMHLAELDELDFASWKNPWAELDDEAPEVDEGLGKVLTLRKLLETVADYDRRVEVAIETKHPTRYGGLVERRLADLVREFGWEHAGSPIRVMSFSYTAMQRMQKLTPDLPLVMLLEKKRAWQGLKAARAAVPPLHDAAWGRPVLTQPAAIATVAAFARERGAVTLADLEQLRIADCGLRIVEGGVIAASDPPLSFRNPQSAIRNSDP